MKDAIREITRLAKESYQRHTGRQPPAAVFADLLLKHGRFYSPRRLPPQVPLGKPQACFHNAFSVALRHEQFGYAEGYALGEHALPFAHGFVVDDTGAFECTLKEPCVLYFGLEFDPLKLVVRNQRRRFETRAFSDEIDWFTDNEAALTRFKAARINEAKRKA